MSLFTLETQSGSLDASSNCDYTYPAITGVKMVQGKYSYQLNQSVTPNFMYSKTNLFTSGRAKECFIVEANHQFGKSKTHDYELVIMHQSESGSKFFVVLPLKIGGTSTLNNVIKSTNTVGDTLDLNKDITNPSNIYRYYSTVGYVFVFDTYINVSVISDDKLTDYTFTRPSYTSKYTYYTTGTQKFTDELVCGKEDVKAKLPPSTDITYIFIMVLFGVIFLTMALIGMYSIANSNIGIGWTDWTTYTDLYFGKRPIFASIFVLFFILLCIFIPLYAYYNKKKKTTQITVFASLSVISTFIAIIALFMLSNTYAPPAPTKATTTSSLGSRFLKSFKNI
jgi:hypothetical protein